MFRKIFCWLFSLRILGPFNWLKSLYQWKTFLGAWREPMRTFASQSTTYWIFTSDCSFYIMKTFFVSKMSGADTVLKYFGSSLGKLVPKLTVRKCTKKPVFSRRVQNKSAELLQCFVFFFTNSQECDEVYVQIVQLNECLGKESKW